MRQETDRPHGRERARLRMEIQGEVVRFLMRGGEIVRQSDGERVGRLAQPRGPLTMYQGQGHVPALEVR